MRRQVQTEPPSQPSVAVAIPAYNEANGIAGFLQEIDRALSPHVSRLSLIVIDDAHAVSGVRRFRQDPWFRMFMTRLVRVYVHGAFGVSARDPNCPLRGYEAALLRDPLAPLPHDCLIPNLYLTLLASRRGVALLEVDVSHRVRRGGSAQGSTWARAARWPVPWRLVHFSVAALLESREFRRQMDTPGWARDESR